MQNMVWACACMHPWVRPCSGSFKACLHALLSASPRTSSGDVRRFSTTSTTPSLVAMPMAVDPSCVQQDQQ